MFIYLIATSRATYSQIGISLGEAAILLIIIAAILIWSAAQIFVSVTDSIIEPARGVYNNETIRNFATAANRCARAIRHEIKHFRTEMRKRNSL
jgi:predicted neutral ceramidase superfamily lipid hydrolase